MVVMVGRQVGRGSGEVEIVCHGESGDTSTVAVYGISLWQYTAYHRSYAFPIFSSHQYVVCLSRHSVTVFVVLQCHNCHDHRDSIWHITVLGFSFHQYVVCLSC